MDKTFKKNLALKIGNRLRIARALANLTRKEIFEKYNINPNTFRSWEIGKNPLSELKAINLVKIFNQEGIAITIEWLLYGNDSGFIDKPNLEQKHQELKDVITIRGDLKILDEVNYFRNNNLNSISSIISDESLFPIFCAGDYVGGINCFEKKLKELVGEFCIITTEDDKIFIKKIFHHQEKNFFLVGSINPFVKSNEPHCFPCAIRAAAKITRHWCVGFNENKQAP